ncbi:hypothetical protein [Streptomyces sp. NPDC058441]|uniref:hypothetical protein n=1 Tax=Streptomyces sp. NPDC058441 TaxID=3346502 RepID=UPI003653A2BA
MSPADYIDVFVHYAPGSMVRHSELFASCKALLIEEHGPDHYIPMRDFDAALKAAGFRVRQINRNGPLPRVKMVKDAAWNDPEFAAEAEASRILAEINRSCATH